ncbi:MAG: DUF4097 family beta strand repeat-containing protein [Candidatus Cloacimonadales bacterium]
MNTLKFEFKYQGSFKELDVRTERMTIVISKGEPEIIAIKGEISLNQEVNYEVSNDKIIEFSASDNRISIDTSELEEDLEDKGVDYANFKLYVYVPDGLRIRAESELGKIIMEHINADSEIETEIGTVLLEDISGDAEIETEIGSVKVKGGSFNHLSCDTEIGNIEIIGTKINKLICESEVGQIFIKEAEISDATINSETGSIEYQLLPLKQSHTKIESEIGKVKLIIPQELNLELKATSEIGGISQNLKNVVTQHVDEGIILKTDKEDSNQATAIIEVSTEIGWISLLNEDTQTEQEKHYSGSRLNREINSAMNEINKVTKVLSSPALRKSLGGAFANLGETIKSSVQSALKESDVAVKQSVKEMQDNLRKQGQDMRGNAFRTEERLSDNEKSRLKILELLEKGMINQEEAEKLLKAIAK